MAANPLCDSIRERLVDLLDDTLEPALREHLADCDACRDLRHEARRAADSVASSGADFVPPADLEARLLAALDARPAETSPAAPAPVPAPDSAADSAREPASSAEPRPLPATRMLPASPAPTGSTRDARVIPFPRSRSFWLASAALAAAAAAAPFAIRAMKTSHAPVAHHDVRDTAPQADAPWHGRAAVVARAGADRTGGLEIKPAGSDAFVALAEGGEIPPGAEIRTDARTRARIDLADGTQLVLDRATDVRFDRAVARMANVVSGAVVADVAHLSEGPSARIAMPNAAITVLGTKFAITATDDRSTVRVTRGTVRLASRSGHEVQVASGEEGVVAGASDPQVSPAVDLADSVAWSELGSEPSHETDAPIVGLGELRARRPGQSRETDHQVTLATHTVRVRVVGTMARTEIDETFRNDTADELEGIYRFPLPPEAQIEKLALDVHGVMQSGEFVDRQRGQAIWHGVIQNAVHPIQQVQQTDELVWVPGPWRDPALLEWQRGGRFELRIFPIPAHGTRRVSIAYTQTIPVSGGMRRYVYPLAHDTSGSTRVEQFDVDLQVLGADPAVGVRARGYPLTQDNGTAPAGATRLTFSQGGFVPAGDLMVEYALADRASPVTAWAFQPPAPIAAPPVPPTNLAQPGAAAPPTGPEPAYVALALRPELPRWADVRPRDYAVIVDTSRSMVGERLGRATRLAGALVAELDPRDRVVVLACDTRCRAMPGGLQFAGAAVAHDAQTFLGTQDAQGASDLVAQVRSATTLLGSSTDRDARIVYFGDGAATVGYRRPELVSAEIAEALPTGHASLTTVALGSDADTTLLSTMARAGGGVMVPYTPGEGLSAAAVAVLEATLGVALRDPVLTLPSGLTDVAPTQLETIRAGGEAIVVARMNGSDVQGDVELRGTVGGEPFEARYPLHVVASSDRGNAFVPRLFAATRIDELERGDASVHRDEIVSLSQRFHVASRFTSLLVLESEAMYRAFGVAHRPGDEAFDWSGEETAVPTVVAATPTTTAASQPAFGPAPATIATGALAEGLTIDEVSGSMGGLGDTAAVDRLAGGGEGAGTTRFRNARGDANESPDDTASATDEPAPSAPATAPAPSRAAAQSASSSGGGGHATDLARRSMPAMTGGSSMANVTGGGAPGGMMEPQHRVQNIAGDGFGRRGQWMRRVWVRHASIAFPRALGSSDSVRIATSRTALEASPDSRTRHQELYRWLSIAGQFDEASDIATRWSTRDALDPDALTRLADIAARRGDRDRSIRVLAGVIDVRPDDVTGHKRMATLHERAGEIAEACAYRVSIAQIQPGDASSLADAVRCERTLGRASAAARLLAGIADLSLRARVDTQSATPSANPLSSSVHGDVTIDANWDVPADLDVALIDPQGRRISWLGGRATGVTARDVRSLRDEALGLSHASTGEWVIEISRTDPSGGAVSGRVDIGALGEHRTLPFVIGTGENTARVARISITREEQLVPVAIESGPGF